MGDIMKQFVLAAAVALAIVSPAEADPSDVTVWSNTNGWMVASDKTFGNACFVVTIFEGNIALRIGFQPKGSASPAYVAIGSPDWKSIEVDKEYQIRMQFDNKTPWDAAATGANVNGIPVLMINFADVNFIKEFMRQLSFRAWFNGSLLAHLSLKGSAAAARELANCQRAVENLGGGEPTSKDPFAVKDRRDTGKDPFAL
jgi:hypothetical protein